MRRFAPKNMSFLIVLGLAGAVAVAAGARLSGQAGGPAPSFKETRVMIPMRDGVKLNTVVFTPEKAAGPLPFLMLRTPYGVPESAGLLAGAPYKELVEDGYIFVFQDIRGRFKSEGAFVMQRPPRDRRDPKAIDESTDAYDTVAWLLAHVTGHNGRVGLRSRVGQGTVFSLRLPAGRASSVTEQTQPVAKV